MISYQVSIRESREMLETILEIVLDSVVSEVGVAKFEGLGAGFEHSL